MVCPLKQGSPVSNMRVTRETTASMYGLCVQKIRKIIKNWSSLKHNTRGFAANSWDLLAISSVIGKKSSTSTGRFLTERLKQFLTVQPDILWHTSPWTIWRVWPPSFLPWSSPSHLSAWCQVPSPGFRPESSQTWSQSLEKNKANKWHKLPPSEQAFIITQTQLLKDTQTIN